MRDASICGLGQTASSAVESAIRRLGVFQGRSRRERAAGPERMVELEVDGQPVRVFEGSTILDACTAARHRHADALLRRDAAAGERVPRLRRRGRGRAVLAPACSRKVEAGMKVLTDSERVRLSRRLVMELLASSVDLSTTPVAPGYLERYGAEPERFGPPAPPSEDRDRAHRPPRRARRPDGGDGAPARQGRQRALRPRLLEVHPLLQVRRRLRRAVPEHVRHPRRRPRLRRAHLDRAPTRRCPSPRASTAATASPCARPAR